MINFAILSRSIYRTLLPYMPLRHFRLAQVFQNWKLPAEWILSKIITVSPQDEAFMKLFSHVSPESKNNAKTLEHLPTSLNSPNFDNWAITGAPSSWWNKRSNELSFSLETDENNNYTQWSGIRILITGLLVEPSLKIRFVSSVTQSCKIAHWFCQALCKVVSLQGRIPDFFKGGG